MLLKYVLRLACLVFVIEKTGAASIAFIDAAPLKLKY